MPAYWGAEKHASHSGTGDQEAGGELKRMPASRVQPPAVIPEVVQPEQEQHLDRDAR